MIEFLNSILKFIYPIIHYCIYPYTFLLKLFILRKKNKTVAYLCNFPIENAGYQYRAKKWGDILQYEGYQVKIYTIFESRDLFNQYHSLNTNHLWITLSLIKRVFHILLTLRTETIIVRRELLMYNEYGNLFMDKLLVKLHPDAILDFDDDIPAHKNQLNALTSPYGKFLFENVNKFNDSLRLYQRFMVASDYLKEKKILHKNPGILSENVIVIPTCVDYDKYPPKEFNLDAPFCFGWIGGSYNLNLLEELIQPFNKLAESYSFKLIVISGISWKPMNARFTIENKKWSITSEVAEILEIDVGLMPLSNSDQDKGKGGFKLIQYMGMGIPAVASAITINSEIIDHMKNGLLIYDHKEWYQTLKYIMDNKNLIPLMGKDARAKIEKKYSFLAHKNNYVNFIKCGSKN